MKRAGEEAEREWRQREGSKDGGRAIRELQGLRIDHGGMVGKIGWWERFWSGHWSVQGVVDALVHQVVVVKL